MFATTVRTLTSCTSSVRPAPAAVAAPALERIDRHLLGYAIRVGIGAIVTGEAAASPEPDPDGRVMDTTLDAARSHGGLGKFQAMTESFKPVVDGSAQVAGEDEGSQVRWSPFLGQHQETRVVGDQMQPPIRQRAPGQPDTATFGHVTNECPRPRNSGSRDRAAPASKRPGAIALRRAPDGWRPRTGAPRQEGTVRS